LSREIQGVLEEKVWGRFPDKIAETAIASDFQTETTGKVAVAGCNGSKMTERRSSFPPSSTMPSLGWYSVLGFTIARPAGKNVLKNGSFP
jgi:hypothetical protein